MSTLEQIEATIERLPRKTQLQVVERLNARLWPSGFSTDVEETWAATAKRRIEELDSGKVKGVSAKQVFAQARRLLTRQ